MGSRGPHRVADTCYRVTDTCYRVCEFVPKFLCALQWVTRMALRAANTPQGPFLTYTISWWCDSGVTMVLQWCDSGVTVVLQWCYSGVTVVLQWCYNGVTAVLQDGVESRQHSTRTIANLCERVPVTVRV
jgi:hypothetical protein